MAKEHPTRRDWKTSDLFNAYAEGLSYVRHELTARLEARELQLIVAVNTDERNFIEGRRDELKEFSEWLDELDDDKS